MERRLKIFKLAFEEFVNRFERVVFNSEVQRDIKSEGLKLRRKALKNYLRDAKTIIVPIGDREKDFIIYYCELELEKFINSVIRYTSLCTTVKEMLIVVGGLAAMVAAGYFIMHFVTAYGLTATLAGLTAIIQFYNTHVRGLQAA